ncbi:MAG: hypothetical protein ACT4N8_04450 [Sphingosinicella sp.]|uniref:hypothetical protein n=1 Tax=Sphingosinicella sp. TaxID=1917971 RepID=UPI004037759D
MSNIRLANQVRPFDWEVGFRIDAIWSGNGHGMRHGSWSWKGQVGVRFENDGRDPGFRRDDS